MQSISVLLMCKVMPNVVTTMYFLLKLPFHKRISSGVRKLWVFGRSAAGVSSLERRRDESTQTCGLPLPASSLAHKHRSASAHAGRSSRPRILRHIASLGANTCCLSRPALYSCCCPCALFTYCQTSATFLVLRDAGFVVVCEMLTLIQSNKL